MSKSGIELIATERKRQIEVEGWSETHDDTHTDHQLSFAARCYAAAFTPTKYPPLGWPWEVKWWKPSRSYRRNLVKAGALIAAEIDRLNRLEKI